MTLGELRAKRSPFDWQEAIYRFEDFDEPHWSQVSGGASRRMPREMVCGYVSCDGAVSGAVGHRGIHGSCPHRIKVCVTTSGSSPKAFAELRRIADSRRR